MKIKLMYEIFQHIFVGFYNASYCGGYYSEINFSSRGNN